MILRKFPLQKTLVLTLHLLTVVCTQDAKSYEDENDWIPITPSTASEKTKKAEPRVLNINAPAQNYFPQTDYVGKRAQPQYVQEISFPKEPVRQTKPVQPYKFEPVLPLQPPHYLQQTQFVQQPQFLQAMQLPYVQTLQQVQQLQPVQRPVQEQGLNQQLVAPTQSTQNYYDSTKTQQYSNLVNSSYFPTASSVPLNQELLGAIQNQNIKENINNIHLTTTTTKPQEEKQSVQLLYVPLENLQNQAVTPQTPRIVKQTEAPRRDKQLISQTQRFNQLSSIQGDFIQQALAAHKLHQQFKLGQPVLIDTTTTTTTTTTPKPKKRKPNQPPLAVYMEENGSVDVKDVLQVLKQVKTIPVQDSVGPGSPKVFVGPYNIDPEGYVKYPLPYLSSVQGNRIERKVEDLPFFVAPLSYKTPDGYAKIPLPSPHVGSVVVSTKQLHEKHQEQRQPQTAQNQIVPDFDVKQPFRDSNKPNTYLVGQNNLQSSQSSLLQFANPFLGGFPNVPQNYDISSSDEYQDSRERDNSEQDSYDDNSSRNVPNYQLDLRDNNQYYETTPIYKNEYYETSTRYKPTERNNIRGSYKVSEYQTTDRELPNQNSKELIRDYDIPSVPVESKTSYTPNYQIEQKPQINQYIQSLSTPKTPADVYSFNQELITTTTTTELPRAITQNRFKVVPSPNPEFTRVVPQDPFRQVINQYEIEQINSQLGEDTTENLESVRSTTPPIASTRKYVEYTVPTTPTRGRSRGRQRGRTTTTTTTQTPLSDEAYTVLEEFNIQPKTSTVKYTTEVETIPAKVYKLESQQPQQASVYQKEVPQTPQTLKQENLNQQILQGNAPTKQPVEQQFLHETTPIKQNVDYSQEEYNVPVRQSLNFNQLPSRSTAGYEQEQASRPVSDFNQQILTGSTADYSPNPQVSTKLTSDFNQQIISSRPTADYNQQLPSRPTVDYTEQISSRPIAHHNQQVPARPTIDYTQQVTSRPIADFKQQLPQNHAPSRVQSETERAIDDIQDPPLTPHIYNKAPETKPQGQAPNSYLPGLINNLQDQAIRPLLSPNLLVPTTEKLTPPPTQPTTEEIRVISSTTETPRIETTTQRRSRGRQRAHNRVTSTSAPRRPAANRRRPSYTRPTTTERQYFRSTSEAPVDYEPTKRVQTQRQRFRTRGRPLQREQATERILQTTENVFKPPELEGGFQASSGDPQSYMQFDHVIDNQQVITIKPQISNEEVTMKEYHQVYSLPPQNPSTERIVEHISTTSKPVVDVKITHPVSSVTERSQEPVIITTPSEDSRFIRVNSNIQTGTTLHHRQNEVTARAPVRQRVRSRTRGRLSSTTPKPTTTTKITTTPKPQQQEEGDPEEEFYGFIRQPNFNNPQPVVQTTTQQSLPLYSASYKQTPGTIIQLEEDNLSSGQNQEYESVASPAPVQFVGQIRPKYTTTEAPEISTAAQKVRIRGRIRVPGRKVTPQPQQSYNEVKPQKQEDPVTRRSSVIRTRGRGKAHFKVPESVSVKNNDDDDVAGGNYPANYLKNILTTEKPSAFQITVDPSDDLYDQEPHASLYSPKILRNSETEWVEASVQPEENDLALEDKLFESSSEEQTTTPFEENDNEAAETERIDEEDATTTETIETTTMKRRKGGKRRGVWKLVKQRPVDSIETAESQNYYAVLNAFDEIGKKQKAYESDMTTTTTTTTIRPKSKTVTSTTEASMFDTLYSILGFASKTSQLPPGKAPQLKTKTKVVVQKEEVTTTTASPTFPEEYTEETTTQEISQTEEEKEGTTIPPTTTTTTTTTTEASVKNYDVEPWQAQEVKTSTSTEVSHMTEICYKGKCIIKRKLKTRL